MQINGEKVINIPIHEIWLGLNDPEVLRKCTPGCKSLVAISDSEFEVEMQVGIAAVKGSFKGHITISDKVPDSSYHVSVDATSPIGFTRMQGALTLTPEGEGTKITHEVDAQIGGMIAGVGQRIMGGFAKKQIENFFSTFEKELKTTRGD